MIEYEVIVDLDRLSRLLMAVPPSKKVIFQFPEGLAGKFIVESGIKGIIDDKQEEPAKVNIYISGDPCYGYCDLPIDQAKNLGADMVLHFGHNDFGFSVPSGIQVHYFKVDYIIDIGENLEQLANKVKWKNTGLIATVQHIKQLEEWKEQLVNKLKLSVKIPGNGQVLGCNYSNPLQIAKQVDGFLLVAGGDFHAKQVPVTTGKPCLRLDPFTGDIKLFGEAFIKQYLNKRYAAILKAKKAKNVGIIVSLKPGQFRKKEIKRIQERLSKCNIPFNIYRFPVNQIIPEILDNYSWIDVWTIDRCPRLALDDSLRFIKPILTFSELEVAAGIKPWEETLPPGVK
ncbi:MAG: diphthamide biosynthesis enzyme Dph2 [Candidatus Hodarchaeales archaeon]|jgi:2-(3-amino-3-carboxypropyl)histidine synthase